MEANRTFPNRVHNRSVWRLTRHLMCRDFVKYFRHPNGRVNTTQYTIPTPLHAPYHITPCCSEIKVVQICINRILILFYIIKKGLDGNRKVPVSFLAQQRKFEFVLRVVRFLSSQFLFSHSRTHTQTHSNTFISIDFRQDQTLLYACLHTHTHTK